MADYEVVISGVSGAFPQCTNIKQFEEALFTNENLVKETEPNWKYGSVNMAPYVGNLKNRYYFDHTFFGVHGKLCRVMDVHCRHSIEKAFEALCDAGINPHDISGTNTAVGMSTMTSETEYGSVLLSKSSGYAMIGHGRCMQANRISYFFNLSGPSFVINASWTAGFQALEIASNMIAKGLVKMAIVGATNIVVFPQLSVNFNSLGKLNNDGKTKCFSADADGYSRSEGAVVLVLQRAEDALRSYGTIVKVRTAAEMNQPFCFVDPGGIDSFLMDFYKDLNINYSDIGYVEADGCASLKVDAMELNGLSKVICSERDEPLYIGSCKSKVGHAESASPLVSLVNAIISFKTGYIPPSILYSKPNPLVPALIDGQLKIVTEKTPLKGDLIGVTCIGFGSLFGHVLLKKNPRRCPPIGKNYFPPDGLPRLFILSGRDKDKMEGIFSELISKPIDENIYALDHNLFKTAMQKHWFRGYSVISKEAKTATVNKFDGAARPVWFVFSGMGSQWNEMGTYLLAIPVVRKAIENCHNILKPKGLDLISIITSTDPTIYDNILHAFVGIAAIQIGLTDLLEAIGVKADGIVGHSVGELGCSYADKCLTAEQVILAAYARGKASNDADLIQGMMAAVGKGYKAIKDELPDGIEVACHNSNVSCTLSGPADIMKEYVEELVKKGVFARLVNVANIAYHSKNITPAAPYLLKYLKEIIPEPKLRSEKWVSSSCPEDKWDTDLAKYCSAEYHTNNLLSYVLFEEAVAHIPKDSICIEIAPHGLLQAIVKKSLLTCIHVPLTNRLKSDPGHFLFEALGNLFTAGLDIDLTKLYPEVKYPVPGETEFFNVVTWCHDEEWTPLAIKYVDIGVSDEGKFFSNFKIEMSRGRSLDLTSNHTVRGHTIYPKSTMLEHFMGVLRERSEKYSFNIKCYAFQDVHFQEDLPFDRKDDILLRILFQMGTGAFEVDYKNNKIISGHLTHTITPLPNAWVGSEFSKNQTISTFIDENQVYDFFKEYGCTYNGPFRTIKNVIIFEKGFQAKVRWTGSSVLYLDSLFKLLEFYSSLKEDSIVDLDQIYQFLYDPTGLPSNDEEIDVFYDENLGCLCADGIRLMYYKIKTLPYAIDEKAELYNLQFVPYSKIDHKADFSELCLQIIRENALSERLNLQVIVDESSDTCVSIVKSFNEHIASSNYKINLRTRNAVSQVTSDARTNDLYLIVTENEHFDDINNLLKSNQKFYLVHTGNMSVLQKKVSLKQITPIIEQSVGTHIVFYKQKVNDVTDIEFLEMPGDDFIREIESVEMDEKKRYFFLYKYTMLSEIVDILQLPLEYADNQRFVFIDESSPAIISSNSVYNDQLVKDLKINIAHKGCWGSLRCKRIDSSTEPSLNKITIDAPLNRIRCLEVQLDLLAINLQSLVFPEKYRKLSVIEYAGLMGDTRVFGLGRIAEGNYLEIDPRLMWKTPKHWTNEEAVTVPLSYSMAYDLICIKRKQSNRPGKSILVHAGQTPLAQAIIYLACEHKLDVYTTCFTEQQRVYILKKCPKVNPKNVFIISDENPTTFQYFIMESTNGIGVEIVIDPFEENGFRNPSLHCTAERGSYYLLTNNEMQSDFSFGMNIFLTQAALFGYNPEFIFDMKAEEKLTLNELLSNGIKMNLVEPFERYCIKKCKSNAETAEIVVLKSKEDRPKKVVVSVGKHVNDTNSLDKTIRKKAYMIMGEYNNLWFDLLKWLASKEAASIHVVLNKEDIPHYLQIRLNNYLARHKYLRVTFSAIDNISSAQMCNNFIKDLPKDPQLETIFYIKPGFEKYLKNIDNALRMHSKNSCLAVIGFKACRLTDKRRNDHFKGVSFMLAKNNLKNNMVVKACETWYKKCSEHDYLAMIDKTAETNEVIKRYADILPSSNNELVDLLKNISERPLFKEVTTRCPTRQHAKDVNPLFIFPGLKYGLMETVSSKLLFPAFIAQYPLIITTLEETADLFCEELRLFDYGMFTLIAEGWSGPLVLAIAKKLENHGIINSIILLDGAPETVKQWNQLTDKSNNVISKYLPNFKEDGNITADTLKRWSVKMRDIIVKEEGGKFTKEEIDMGLNILANRLDVLQQFSVNSLESTIHLFTPSNEIDTLSLNMVTSSFHRYIYDSSERFLENSMLIEDLHHFPLVEHKMRANKQIVKEISTFNLIGDDGVDRPFNLRKGTIYNINEK